MAFYAFLMQLDKNTTLTENDVHRMSTISEIGGAISIVTSVLTLSLLCLLPIKNDGLFIVGNTCLVLMAAQISFIGAESAGYPDPVMCKIAACVIHYFFLCVSFASFTYAIHLWSKLGPQWLQACRRKAIYLCTTWMVPGAIVIVTVMIRGDLYAKEKRCWLPAQHFTRLAFLLPLAFVQIMNWIMYFMIIRAGIILDLSKKENLTATIRHACLSSLSLFAILGLQWVLGYTITFGVALPIQYLFVVLASGQGLFLLTFHVLPNGHIQKALCSKIADKLNSSTSSPTKTVPATVDSLVDTTRPDESDSDEITMSSHVEYSSAKSHVSSENTEPKNARHEDKALSTGTISKMINSAETNMTSGNEKVKSSKASKSKNVSFAKVSTIESLVVEEAKHMSDNEAS